MSSSTSSDNKWKILVGVGCVAAVGVAGLLAYGYKSYVDEKRTIADKAAAKKEKKKKQRDGISTPPNEEKSISKQGSGRKIFDVNSFKTKLLQCSERIQIGETSKDAVEEKKLNSQILKWSDNEISGIDTELRLLAANYISLFNDYQFMVATQSEEATMGELYKLSTSNDRKEAYHKAWKLLDVEITEELQLRLSGLSTGREDEAKIAPKRQHALLKLDVAQRLEDLDKLTTAFNTFVSDVNFDDTNDVHSKLSPNEKTVVFSVSPIIGRWDITARLGQCLLDDDPQCMSNFHKYSLSAPLMPDYSVMFDIAKQQLASGKSKATTGFRFAKLEVTAIRTRPVDVKHPDPNIRQMMMSELTEEDKRNAGKWISLSDGQRLILRSGAIAQSQGIFLPLPILGIVSDDHMDLQGYATINPQSPAKHTEYLVLKRVESIPEKNGRPGATTSGDEKLWVGKLNVKQTPDLEVMKQQGLGMVSPDQLHELEFEVEMKTRIITAEQLGQLAAKSKKASTSD